MPEFMWNGVGLAAPDGWEPGALERDSLLLENAGAPACEIKWRRIEGTFSFAKHIKRLSKAHKGTAITAVPEDETPAQWGAVISGLAESGMQAQSFIWQGGGHRGIGAALHNPATGLATLIQFFITGEEDEFIAARTLATFRDYLGGKTMPWSMFGLHFRTPSWFLLDTFSFKPGRYTVKLWLPRTARQGAKLPPGKGPGTHLILERFAPANVLLKSTPLDDWLADTLDYAPPENVPLNAGSDSVAWAGKAKTSLLRRLMHREVMTAGRVWTTDQGNAILSVAVHGAVPVDTATINDIAAGYEFV